MKFLAFIAEHARVIGAWIALGLACLFDIFTVHGFLFAFGLEAGDDLLWPMVTRVTWLLIFYVVGSASVQRLMWREGVLYFDNHFQLWAASHVDMAKRLGRRWTWWLDGLKTAFRQHQAHRPAVSWWRRHLPWVPQTPRLDGVPGVSSPAPRKVQDAPVPTPAAA